jgi:hypothetical protein
MTLIHGNVIACQVFKFGGMWNFLQPTEQCQVMDFGCNQLATVAQDIYNRFGWRFDRHLTSSVNRPAMSCCIFKWLIHISTLADPWVVISILWIKFNKVIRMHRLM